MINTFLKERRISCWSVKSGSSGASARKRSLTAPADPGDPPRLRSLRIGLRWPGESSRGPPQWQPYNKPATVHKVQTINQKFLGIFFFFFFFFFLSFSSFFFLSSFFNLVFIIIISFFLSFSLAFFPSFQFIYDRSNLFGRINWIPAAARHLPLRTVKKKKKKMKSN